MDFDYKLLKVFFFKNFLKIFKNIIKEVYLT